MFDFKLKWTNCRRTGNKGGQLFVASFQLAGSEFNDMVVNEFMVHFTEKYTNNLAHAHYRPCNEYQAVFSDQFHYTDPNHVCAKIPSYASV